MNKKTIFAFITIVILSSQYLPTQPEGGPPEMPPVPVTTTIVEAGGYSQPINITGNVEARIMASLASEVAGIVEKVYVEEGDVVTEKQALAHLRALPMKLEAERAKASYDAAMEKVREMEEGTRAEDIAIAKSDYDRNLVLFQIAEKKYKRNLSLLESQVISPDEFEVSEERFKTMKAQLALKESELNRAKAGPRKQELAAEKSKADAAKATWEFAKDRFEKTIIRAPFSGIIIKRHIEIGEWLNAGDTVYELQNIDIVDVRANVPERFFNQIALDDITTITFDSVPGREYVGKVKRRIAKANERSRTFPMEMELENKDKKLAPGMLARIEIASNQIGKSVVVPRDALVPRGPMQAVYRVKEIDSKPTAEMIMVKTGRYFGKAVEVFGDLKKGDQIITRGNERLQPGAPLMINTFLTR